MGAYIAGYIVRIELAFTRLGVCRGCPAWWEYLYGMQMQVLGQHVQNEVYWIAFSLPDAKLESY